MWILCSVPRISVVLVQEKPVFDILSNKEHTQKKKEMKKIYIKKEMRRKIVSSFSFFSSTFELHWGSVWNCVMERQRCQLVENYRRILDRYSNKTFTSAFLLQCSSSSCSSFSKKSYHSNTLENILLFI